MDLIYTWLCDIGDELVTDVSLHENAQKKLAGVNNSIPEGVHSVTNYIMCYSD
jgi:hypothetical protein